MMVQLIKAGADPTAVDGEGMLLEAQTYILAYLQFIVLSLRKYCFLYVVIDKSLFMLPSFNRTREFY